MNEASASSNDVSIGMSSRHGLSVPETSTFARKDEEQELLDFLESDQDVNKFNKYGDTALIRATRSGLIGVITALMKRDADITHRNNDGDDAFKVAVNQNDIAVLELLVSSVKDKSTGPGWSDRLHPLLCRTLHEAAKHGSCETISMLISVGTNLELKDEKGNTFLHTAAALNQPEVIKTFSTKFDVNVQNDNGDSPLHVACQQVAHEAILSLLEERANPGIQNKVGDTTLHCLTNALNSVPDRPEKHKEVIINLLEKWIEWWSFDKDSAVPNDEEAFVKYKVKGFEYFREALLNEANESVFTLAFKNGCVPVIKALFTIQNGTCFNPPNRQVTQYIVTDLAPKVRRRIATKSHLEILLENNCDQTIEEVLNLEPVKKFEVMYNSMTSVIYFIIIFLHTLYMSIFSYCATEIMEDLRSASESSRAMTIVFYCTTPLEPACLIIALVYKFHCSKTKWSNSRYLGPGTFVVQCFSIIHHVIYALLIIALLYQYYTVDMYNMHNTLSVTLLVGWLTTLSFTQGLKPFRFFWRMTLKMIVVDVYKMLFVYVFILLGFTFALHVQFQVSEPVIGTYPNPMYTMFIVFRLMLGMGTLFDGDFLKKIEKAGGSTSLPIVLYVLYLVLATIVLLNLLIAMMNTSYSDILTNMKTSRRVESLQRAFDLEKNAPFVVRKLIGNLARCGSVKGQCLVLEETPSDSLHWYVEVRRPRSVTSQTDSHLDERVTQRMALLESDVRNQLAQIHTKLDAINNMLRKLQSND